LTRIPDGFEDLVPLPKTFGWEAYRGRAGGIQVLVLCFSVEPATSQRTEFLRSLARRWETLAQTCEVLVRPLRWFLEGPTFFVVFPYSGGPLVAELVARKETEVFDQALLPFLDRWGALVDQGFSLAVLDPSRLVLTPEGLQSVDLIHLVDLSSGLEAVPPSPMNQDDLVLVAPEMTRRTALPVDLRSGLFSLGNLLFRFASGRWPLAKSDSLEMVHALLNRAPDFEPAVSETSGAAPEAILKKLLRKDPAERYQTLRGLKWDLGQRGRNREEGFVPGTHDRALPIADVRRTYGRQEEQRHLSAALTLLDDGHAAILVFRGAGGQGKSRLVEDLRRDIESAGARWLQGKFDQYNHRFSAGALVSILEKWVDSSPAQVKSLTGVLRNQLGRNLRILTALVPSLAEVWEVGPELPSLGPAESQRRFVDTLVAFFGVLAVVQPLVLLVEDIHWADELSVKVLEGLAGASSPRLGLVGTLRPGGETRLEPFLEAVQRRSGPGQGLHDLGPLVEGDVLELLSDCADLEPADALVLARSLLGASSGNPFALQILLKEVNLRQAVVFDESTEKWRLEPERLRDLPDDQAVGLLSARLQSVAPELGRALLAASLLGSDFQKSEVLAVGEVSSDRFDQAVEELVELGFWERQGPSEFRFSHDKVRQAVYESAGDAERTEAHLRLGRGRLARRAEGEACEPAAIAVHLNHYPDRLSAEEKAQLTALNLEAGDQARQNSDFAASLDFYKAAIELGGTELWEESPERALALYRAGAEMAYTGFRRDLGDQWCDHAVGQRIRPLERAKIRERQQNLLFYLGDIEGSIEAGIQGLRELGMAIPANPGTFHVVQALAAVKASLIGRTTETLSRQATNRNEVSRTAMLLLSGFIPPAFHAGRQNLFGLAVLKAVQLTIRDGLCAESAPSYTGYAVLLAALGDFRGAYAFGGLATALNQRFDDLKWRSMVLVLTGLFCNGWFEPWYGLRSRFEAARRASEESGDFLYRSYADLFATLWNPGEDLPLRIEHTRDALGLILKYRFPLTRVSAYFVLAGLRNLAEPALGGTQFSTEAFDAKEGLEEYRRLKSNSGLAVCYSVMVRTYFLLGHLDQAGEALLKAEAVRPAIAGSLYEEDLTLFSGLVTADLIRTGDRRGARRLRRCRRRTGQWARCSQTFRFHVALLTAEEHDLAGHAGPAQKAFLEAVEAADQSGFLDYQALSRERAAGFFGRHGGVALRRYFHDEAIDRWRRYGAWAKVALLEASADVPTRLPIARPDASGDMDLVSLVRALEAISREIHVEPLTRTVTKLILENSGADRVVLLVPSEGEFLLEGEATATGFQSGDRRPLSSLTDLPQAFLRRALATRRILVIEDVSEQDRKTEPVLASRGVKSLICLPLGTPEGLRALVYLENKVMTGILTQTRTKILELLSSTIGVALQNAQLFQQVRRANEGLERRVEERTQELQASQKKIILQEKLASLGALTAGIAHELKNPFNIINNFAESSVELMGELENVLAPVRPLLDESVREELNYLVPELTQNLRDIGVHGRRGDAIIRSMLMHSRSDGGKPTLEDLDALVQESMGLSYHAMRASHKDFQCRTDSSFDPRVPPMMMIRPNLGRVLINLFTNALQAVQERQVSSPPEDWQPRVTATTQWLGNAVRITVEDNGVGIAPELLDKIFQPFFTTKAPGEGTGLGLSISYEIIREEFGGSLEAQVSDKGHTQFLVTLPASRPGKE